eukprot:gene25559-31237_t
MDSTSPVSLRWPLLQASANQLATFAAVCTLLFFTLRVLDPHNPKGGPLKEWPPGAGYSLAILISPLLLVFGFDIGVAFLLPNAPSSTPKARDQDSAALTEPAPVKLPALLPSERQLGIAWPTVLLTLTSATLHLSTLYLVAANHLRPAYAVMLCTFTTFCSFTPMHDAVHGAIAPRHRWLNDLLGTLASAPFFFFFQTFKVLHLAHHRHANTDAASDPDHWAGEGPVALLPFRWATVFFWYNTCVMRKVVERSVAGEAISSPWEVAWRETRVFPAVFVTVMWWKFEMLAVTLWLLPFLLGASWLMYVFDYVPHRPHLVPHQENPYLATNVTTHLHPSLPSGHMSLFLLYQNYHNIHHLYPFLPFYRYETVWHRLRNELLKRGTRELPFFLLPGREAYLHELKQKP